MEPTELAYRDACDLAGLPPLPDIAEAFGARRKHFAGARVLEPHVLALATALQHPHALRSLALTDSFMGADGAAALVEAVCGNPRRLRELRFIKCGVDDDAAVCIGKLLSEAFAGGPQPLGLKVVDLSQNDLTYTGCAALCMALAAPEATVSELSLHSNHLSADAAPCVAHLLQARPHSGLKHLHLGYNLLRDQGAVGLCAALPTSTLLTLDLSGNRIGAAGGEALCDALLRPDVRLQRLNLRHNLLPDDVLGRFADVVAGNTSLRHLYLGHMVPEPLTASLVLNALADNDTLVLFDIVGWRLAPEVRDGLLEFLLQANTALRALVSDDCRDSATVGVCDAANAERGARGQPHVAITDDEQAAAAAAAATAESAPEPGPAEAPAPTADRPPLAPSGVVPAGDSSLVPASLVQAAETAVVSVDHTAELEGLHDDIAALHAELDAQSRTGLRRQEALEARVRELEANASERAMSLRHAALRRPPQPLYFEPNEEKPDDAYLEQPHAVPPGPTESAGAVARGDLQEERARWKPLAAEGAALINGQHRHMFGRRSAHSQSPSARVSGSPAAFLQDGPVHDEPPAAAPEHLSEDSPDDAALVATPKSPPQRQGPLLPPADGESDTEPPAAPGGAMETTAAPSPVRAEPAAAQRVVPLPPPAVSESDAGTPTSVDAPAQPSRSEPPRRALRSAA